MESNVLLNYMEKIIKNVEDLKKNLEKISAESSITCFRGEAQDYQDTKLMPSLFRINDGKAKDIHLMELLSDYEVSNSLLENDISYLNRAIDGQHFIALSRLLDVTFSLLPAIYFACTDNDLDGYVYSFVFPESYSPSSKYIKERFTKTINGEFRSIPSDFKVLTHSYSNDRVKMQSGGFILFAGNVYTEIPKIYYGEPIKIENNDKKKILEELEDYFNITEATIYPEKDKRRGVIESKLMKKNLKINPFEKELESELKNYIRRFEYEDKVLSKLTKNNSVRDDMKRKRILRKQKQEIIDFINFNFSSSEKIDELKIKYVTKINNMIDEI